MAGNYPLARVGDLAESISETHKKEKQCLIFLNTSDILHGKFLHRTYTAVRDWPGQAKKSIQKDDILFSEIRPANGRWAYVDEDADDYVVSTKLMVIRARKDRLLPKFLYQFLTSSAITGWLQHLAESRSGTFPQITFDQVASLEIPLPSFSDQQAIACILGALDDKIELNRRMNQTLEAMARAIFKSWFVDFDPVPGHGPHKEWQDSPLGRVPKGWGVSRLGDIIELSYGKALKEDIRQSGNIPVYGSNGQVGWHNESLVNGPGIVVGRKGNPGIVTWVPKDFYPIDTTFYIVPKGTIQSMYYFFHALKQQDLASLGADSAVPGLNRNMAYMNRMIVPPANLILFFDKQATTLADKVNANNEQSRTLAAIRDALLPRLISGELPILDAERIVGRCI